MLDEYRNPTKPSITLAPDNAMLWFHGSHGQAPMHNLPFLLPHREILHEQGASISIGTCHKSSPHLAEPVPLVFIKHYTDIYRTHDDVYPPQQFAKDRTARKLWNIPKHDRGPTRLGLLCIRFISSLEGIINQHTHS